MKPQKYSILLLLAILIIVFAMGSVSAADTYVNSSVTTSGDGSSWEQAYKTIIEGYNGVTNGGTINIASGTYTGEENKKITLNKNITIQGARSNQTIIDLQDADYAFRIANYNNVTIKDLTIQNGNNEPNGGGAIFNYNYGNLTLEKVTFKNNRASIGGAIENFYGNLKVTDCTFTGNTASMYGAGAGGGAICNMGNMIITGTTFYNNTANWSGGAIWNSETLVITGSTFINNTAGEDGGAIYNEANPLTITSSIFSGNKAEDGGAISISSGNLNIIGCNFNKNAATDNGGAIYSYSDLLNVKYSRFVGNTVANNLHDIYTGNYGLIATLNWWGSNTGPASGRITGSEGSPTSDTYTPWLILNINPADPSTIYTGQTSKISVNVYTDSNGVDHSADAAQFFSGPEVTFTTNLGNVGSKEVTVPWTFGIAFAVLRGDEGPGVATVTAADIQTLSTTVNILQTPVTPDNEVNAASNTVGMQETGLPVNYMIITVLLVIGGFLVPKKK